MFDFQDLTLAAALLIVAETAGILLAIDAVMRRRSSQGAIAWCIGLVSMPFVTIPLYVLFGRTSFHGYAERIHQAAEQVSERADKWFANMQAVAKTLEEPRAPIDTIMRSVNQVGFTRGNRVKLLVDAEATYAEMLAAIAEAETYVFVQFFIVRDDESGRALRDALIERARAGVNACFLYDEIGSIGLSQRYLQAMRDTGIKVSGFRTTQGFRNRFQINFRNHRKLLIVDGRIGFVGGHNLGNEYLKYRDTHLRIDGPAAQQIHLTFAKDWYWATHELNDVPIGVHLAEGHDQAVSLATTGPADRLPWCSILFGSLVMSAQRRVWITSPYFVPDDYMTRALQSAALRGVDVRIVVPGVVDKKTVWLASLTYYEDMIASGVKLYRYRDRFMHQKVILVDDDLAGVGTVNLDNRSLYLNFEETALVADAGFAKEIEAMLLQDLADSDAVAPDHFASQPAHYRVAAHFMRLASPLL